MRQGRQCRGAADRVLLTVLQFLKLRAAQSRPRRSPAYALSGRSSDFADVGFGFARTWIIAQDCVHGAR